MKEIEEYILDATQNIKEDRAATKTLLISLMKYMTISEDRHKEVGMVAAKYVETLQRSNEQLVKLAALLQKRTGDHRGISQEEKDELFDLIQDNAAQPEE